ncbi:diguanylate cyclase (GGDEF)-like protein [Peribacillus deserti]|uniref:Diguanylate cyclase (GGDEF)-like protein n=1 Tax=Peribacillus deserti TaxID=673318 RepID=A0ABS2QIE1_9BACI|nr:diguanylate cyclase [Peribacillus deserti]MBM7692908.1 diguanylate cyclase (GGDEF)-like protein [Peribacillus deserti]
MNLHKSKWSGELKSSFFDLLDVDNGYIRFEEYISALLKSLEEILDTETIIFMKYDEWKQELITEASSTLMEGSSSLHVNPADPLIQKTHMKVFYNEPPCPGLSEFRLVLPLRAHHQLVGILAIKENDQGSLDLIEFQELERLAGECTNLIKAAKSLSNMGQEEKRYKQLFRVTEKFHSSMNMDAVLEEIIHTLQDVYPDFTYYLLLSHDNSSHKGLPIKGLEYDSENTAAMQAFLTGTIQMEDSRLHRISSLYAPLKGKQGVYGVLQVIAANTVVFPKDEVEFIRLLANTAGGALENAQLYQQSKRLVADLQLINETSHKLNSNLRLSDTILYMRNQISKSFQAEEIGFITLGSNQQPAVLVESTDFFHRQDSASYIEFLTKKITIDREPLYIGDTAVQEAILNKKYRSIMAVPMIQIDSLKGYAVVLHQDPYFFTFDMFKLLQSLIHHSTLAFANSMLREELEKMVITDSLTKLFSRNFLDEKIASSFEKDEQGTFILMDIDDFKIVNDTYGHQVGDEVLVQVANLILKNIRGTDIGARWGGEELAVYLPDVPLSIGVAIAKRLVEKVNMTSNPKVTISSGMSHWKKGRMDSAKSLFKRADEALYRAKKSGKNKLIIHEDDIVLLP